MEEERVEKVVHVIVSILVGCNIYFFAPFRSDLGIIYLPRNAGEVKVPEPQVQINVRNIEVFSIEIVLDNPVPI